MLCRTGGLHSSQSDVLKDDLADDAGCCLDADWTVQLKANEHSSTWHGKMSQCKKTESSADHGYDTDGLQHGRKSSVMQRAGKYQDDSIMQHAGKYRDDSVELKHNARRGLHATASMNKDQSYSDSWTTIDSDWSLPSSNVSSSFTSRDNAAEKAQVPSHVQSRSDVCNVPDVNVGEVVSRTFSTAESSGLQGRDPNTGQMAEMDTLTKHESASMTEPRRSRGRGLMNFRQLQAGKMASQRTPGRSSGSADVSSGSADKSYRAVTPPGMSVTGADTEFTAPFHADTVVTASSHVAQSKLPMTDGHMAASGNEVSESGLAALSLNTTGSSASDGQGSSAVRQHPKSSSVQTSSSSSLSRPTGVTEPASLPASCPTPMTSYQPHMLPFTWPAPPLCGVVPPGFACVGQTMPVPYSSLPLYPAYGYPMLPTSWSFLPPTFDSVPLPADESQNNVHKVD